MMSLINPMHVLLRKMWAYVGSLRQVNDCNSILGQRQNIGINQRLTAMSTQFDVTALSSCFMLASTL